MKLLIDADGSPVVNITIEIAKDFAIPVDVVKNFAHEIHSNYANVISVDVAQDSADYYIVNRCKPGDIVITQDYGLAALALTKKALPLNQNGHIFTNNNIDRMLDQRYVHGKMRKEKKRHSNPKKRTAKDDLKFEQSLRKLIKENLE